MLKETNVASTHSGGRYFPLYGLVALAICLSAWICSWLRVEPFYRYSFFPLWAGFIFFLDALAVLRHGSSLLQRMGWRYLLLFAVSSLFWWIFEWLNTSVQNWHYRLDQPYSPLAYFLLASLNFSTVLPAVMEIAELLSTLKPLHPRLSPDKPGPRLPLGILLGIELLGWACLALPWIFPRYCFVLIWLSVAFILDPINNFAGRKSALAHIAVGDWRFFVLPLAGLCCGFFWEMWNFYALPKWYYTIPYVGFWKIFEMPVLGYLGYLPFALELFALYQFVLLVTRQKHDYLVI
jgi:hypothetical protein